MTLISKGPTGRDMTRHITPVPFPPGDPLACRTVTHDVCVVTADGCHHTYDRWHPERGIHITDPNRPKYRRPRLA